MSARTPSVLFLHEIERRSNAGFGGAERYLELLAGGLSASGTRAGVALFGMDDAAGRQLAERLEPVVERVFYAPSRATRRLVARAAKETEPDVLHWNFPYPFSFSGSSLLLLPWGRPSVVTDHLPMVPGAPHTTLVRRIANRRVAAMIVVGETARAAALERWHRAPLHVVRNGVPLQTGVCPRPARDENEPVRLAFVGRLEEQKNPLFALEVARGVADAGIACRIRFVGTGTLAEPLRKEVHAGNPTSLQVELAGFSEDVPAELANADLLLAPSTFEGLPFVPLEALAAGVPVLASDIPPHREIAAAAPAVRIAPLDDVEAWVAAALAAIPRLAELSADALRSAELFSVERMVDATRRVYESVAAPKR